MKKILLILLTLILFIPIYVNASADKEVNIYLFYGEGCPHCEAEKEFLMEYTKDKPYIKMHLYEVWYDKNNSITFEEVQDVLEIKARGVPYTIIGNRVISGYGEYKNSEIVDNIEYARTNEFKDLAGIHLGIVSDDGKTPITSGNNNESGYFEVPILGKINAKNVSLPLVSMVIGLVDGFNPCAMWILIFLITMLIGMKDRKKMWALGLTFLISSAIVYLLFMVSWLNIAVFVNKIVYIRAAIGILAIVFGIWNIYNFRKSLKVEDGCEIINDKKRKKIMATVKNITSNKSLVLSILGVIALAFSTNVIELLCSLGLPVIFTQILSINSLHAFEYGIYMLIYMIFFLIDDLIIFIIAMKTFEIKGISTKFTKYSHLVGGIIMFILGILMIFKPEWLMFNF